MTSIQCVDFEVFMKIVGEDLGCWILLIPSWLKKISVARAKYSHANFSAHTNKTI